MEIYLKVFKISAAANWNASGAVRMELSVFQFSYLPNERGTRMNINASTFTMSTLTNDSFVYNNSRVETKERDDALC